MVSPVELDAAWHEAGHHAAQATILMLIIINKHQDHRHPMRT